ncbi:MAG: sulfatase-like hydrolase/transferase [Verrucomicrobia bacterium]|nr:sulfatase-like hydrolase/transferase [Verrucomicrobiota bacterium]MCH8526998.1 sulfatase-like hydrolase/transferase [Kiritimatiellia bacterium]
MKPNILLICTDQHRHDYLGCRGADWLSTPNLDALASIGTRFTNAFTNSPVCSPARCALATGMQPHRIGCLDNGSFLPHSARTFYQQLRDHQYWTGYVGKLDLAKPAHPEKITWASGRCPRDVAVGFCAPFDTDVGMLPVDGESSPYGRYLAKRGLLDAFNDDRKRRISRPGIVAVSNFSHGKVDLRREEMPPGWFEAACADSPLPSEHHPDPFIADRALDWLGSVDRSGPWFLQVNFFGPHDPFDPPAEYGQKYRSAAVPDAIPANFDGKPEWVGKRFIMDDPEQVRFSRRQYSGVVEQLDTQVGRLLALLEETGQRDNTIIVMTSDHGEMLGDFGLYMKHVPYEASIRIPMLFAGPGIPRGAVVDDLVELIDLNPTLCELAGAPPLPETDARSLLPLFSGKGGEHRDSILSAENHFRCLRTRKWKLVVSHNDREELYDLENDPRELHNLAETEECRDTLRHLRGELGKRWMEGMWRR